jgi:predicted transcriptional regulator
MSSSSAPYYHANKRNRIRYRGRIDIICDILDAAIGVDVTKTRIMYKSLLSYVQLREFLPVLTENGLLSFNEKTHTFRTTEKGLQFLKIYSEIRNILGKVEEQEHHPHKQLI